MSRVRLTFFRQPSDTDEDQSVRSTLNLADWGVKGAAWEPEAFSSSGRLVARSPEPAPAEPETADPLAAFDSEQHESPNDSAPPLRPHALQRPPQPPAGVTPAKPRSRRLIGVLLLLAATATALGLGYGWGDQFGTAADPSEPAVTSDGRAIISSNPPGALVFIDGVARGATPIDLMLPVGTHTVQLQNGAALRTLPLEIAQGQVATQYIELPIGPAASVAEAPVPTPPSSPAPRPPTASAAGTGRASQPPAQPSAERPVARDTRAASPPPPAQASAPSTVPPTDGWVSIVAPFPVQVTENGRALGSTTAGPVKLPAGLHTLELTNSTYEFSTTLAVRIAPGETTSTPLTVPTGLLSVNALPWAEVFVDGRAIGTTPLANVAVPIGPREVLWRHPEHGERRQLVTITARTPVRIGTDFNR